MNPDRWSRVRDIFDQTADEPESRQAALVHAACEDDSDLEAEVLRLLEAVHVSSDFLESGAGDLYGELLEQRSSSPALAVGAVLARRFEVRSFIDRGGMGEVYEAWDTQLNQAVALKIILPHISAHPAIIERFKQEVRLAREVSHPNICRVHELFCEEPVAGPPIWFLSMELLRGTTLLAHIRANGPLSLRSAEHLADAMLSGLQAAHARGLVHRDFKSGNVMLLDTPPSSVRAVITDFGLAITSLPGLANGSDLIARGTPGYMAPEQKLGELVGPAADQYAFGVVLWEMMTGRTPPETGDLSMPSRGDSYPKTWPRVIQRCTAAIPSERFPDMAAVRSSLLRTPVRKRVVWAEAAAILLAAGVGLLLWKRHIRALPAACVICNTVQITPDVDKSETPSLSQDGRFVAYSSDRAEPGNLDIFVQKLPSGPVVRLTRDGARDTVPSISPDGSQVAFRSERDGGGLYLVPTQAPEQTRLLVPGGRDPKFSADGKSLLYWTGDPDSSAPSGKAFRLDLASGAAQPVAAQFEDARYPIWNSNGREVLLTGCLGPGLLPDCLDWWVAPASKGTFTPTYAFASLRAGNFLPGRLNSLEWRGDELIYSSMNASGRLNLAEIPLPPGDSHAIGQPRWLLPSDSGELDASVSAGGSIAFTRTTGALHIWKMDGLIDKKRLSLEKVTEDPQVDGQPFVAEGGRFLVFTRGRSAQRVVVLRDLQSGQERVVWNKGMSVQSPIVDSNGAWLAFQQTDATGRSAVYAGRIGGATMKRICENCSAPFGWFAQDRMFFFRSGLKALSLADPRNGQQQPVLSDTEALLGDASWSAATGNLVLVASSPARKRIEVVHLDSANLHPQPPVFMPDEPGTPLHPRWYGNGSGIVYTSNRDGFMCLYRRRFDVASQRFGDSLAAAHIHNQRASIDEVLPRVLNLSADGDTLYLNLGEQSSTIQIGTLAEGR